MIYSEECAQQQVHGQNFLRFIDMNAQRFRAAEASLKSISMDPKSVCGCAHGTIVFEIGHHAAGELFARWVV